MKKLRMKPVDLLRYVWRSLLPPTNRRHDPFLVFSMASFNYGGGWRDLLVKASAQNV